MRTSKELPMEWPIREGGKRDVKDLRDFRMGPMEIWTPTTFIFSTRGKEQREEWDSKFFEPGFGRF